MSMHPGCTRHIHCTRTHNKFVHVQSFAFLYCDTVLKTIVAKQATIFLGLLHVLVVSCTQHRYLCYTKKCSGCCVRRQPQPGYFKRIGHFYGFNHSFSM